MAPLTRPVGACVCCRAKNMVDIAHARIRYLIKREIFAVSDLHVVISCVRDVMPVGAER